MSTNSILVYNKETLSRKYSEKLDSLAKRYTYRRYFRVGEEIPSDEIEHVLIMHRILCTDRCEIIDYVADIISGKLEECGIKPKDKKLKTLKECCDNSNNLCEFDKCAPRIEF